GDDAGRDQDRQRDPQEAHDSAVPGRGAERAVEPGPAGTAPAMPVVDFHRQNRTVHPRAVLSRAVLKPGARPFQRPMPPGQSGIGVPPDPALAPESPVTLPAYYRRRSQKSPANMAGTGPSGPV